MMFVNNFLKIGQFIKNGKRGEEQSGNSNNHCEALYIIKYLCFIETIPMF